jgi:hypothetical protein
MRDAKQPTNLVEHETCSMSGFPEVVRRGENI